MAVVTRKKGHLTDISSKLICFSLITIGFKAFSNVLFLNLFYDVAAVVLAFGTDLSVVLFRNFLANFARCASGVLTNSLSIIIVFTSTMLRNRMLRRNRPFNDDGLNRFGLTGTKSLPFNSRFIYLGLVLRTVK